MIRVATLSDLKRILEILEEAKIKLKEMSIDQWQSGYPNKEVLENDIILNRLYVFEDKIIKGFCAFYKDEELNYRELQWSSDNSMVIHRLAVSTNFLKEGIADSFVDFFINYSLYNKVESIKIDTHKGNYKMLSLIRKHKFSYVGYLKSIDREAFELKLVEV